MCSLTHCADIMYLDSDSIYYYYDAIKQDAYSIQLLGSVPMCCAAGVDLMVAFMDKAMGIDILELEPHTTMLVLVPCQSQLFK